MPEVSLTTLEATALPSVAPIENLSLPRELDGSAGSNRAKIESTVISARNDLQAIVAWLARFTDTKTGFGLPAQGDSGRLEPRPRPPGGPERRRPAIQTDPRC